MAPGGVLAFLVVALVVSASPASASMVVGQPATCHSGALIENLLCYALACVHGTNPADCEEDDEGSFPLSATAEEDAP